MSGANKLNDTHYCECAQGNNYSKEISVKKTEKMENLFAVNIDC